MNTLKHELLKLCISILNGIANTDSDPNYGSPPKVFYIDFAMGDRRDIEHCIRFPEETYRYENGNISTVGIGTSNAVIPVSGMYFPEGRVSIGIDLKNSFAYLSFQIGPRYGRGFRFRIVDSIEGKTLGDKEELWVS